MIRIQQLKLPLTYTQETLLHAAAKELKISVPRIQSIQIKKRSIDARKKPDIHYVASVDVRADKEAEIVKKCKNSQICIVKETPYRYPQPGNEKLKHRPVIIGSGPAGLFCCLVLARCGYQPILLERGEDVDARSRTIERFWNGEGLDEHSNVQFGEGGAGTFSDGKLNTMVKDTMGRNRYVLETFVNAGADADILYVNKPHIGTDVLRSVVKNIREEILRLGGEVHFSSRVTDIEIEDGTVRSVCINETHSLACEVLVLAIGHSARDTFEMLSRKPVEMTAKSFAVGLRIEHPQALINRSQYRQEYPDFLPAADYKLTKKLDNGRGVYSFCMCPGGYVVNASSEKGHIAVNGMSYHARDSRNANSAIVVTVTPEDFGFEGVFGGVKFQRQLEAFAFRAGKGDVPVQLFGDFCLNKESRELGSIEPCIRGAYRLANLREGIPAFLGTSLEEGIKGFERMIPGFARYDAVLAGVESRTSSPVRIVRGSDFMSNIAGLYPSGEGAGYAGGITSAAMDGIRTAEAVIKKYTKF